MKIKKILLKIKKCLLNLWEFPPPPRLFQPPCLLYFGDFSRALDFVHTFINILSTK